MFVINAIKKNKEFLKIPTWSCSPALPADNNFACMCVYERESILPPTHLTYHCPSA